MNKSLAARQEALQQQNHELNEQVEAIEQRRQQLTNTSRPSSSSTSLQSASHLSIYRADSTENDDERNYPKLGLQIELSASIDSLSSQEITEACRSYAKSDKKDTSTNLRTTSAKRSERKKSQSRSKMPPEDALPSRDSINVSPNDGSDPKGLSLEATVRYQKARLHVLQHEADAATDQAQQLQATQVVLKNEIENLKTQNSTLLRKNQQTQQLFEKHRELSAAQEEEERILEGQLASAQARVEETLRAEKLASQQFRSKDVRLNRALEEIEKLKAQLQDEKKNHDEKMISKAEYDQIVQDNKKLDKQKGELLIAFKKQMKLIDLLKRQRVHMEVAKMLSFTEAEFSKTLELS